MKNSLTLTKRRDGSVTGRASGKAAQALFDSLCAKPADSGAALVAAAHASDSVRVTDNSPPPGPSPTSYGRFDVIGDPTASLRTVTFSQPGTFDAIHAAELWCSENDIAVGRMERDLPMGLMWGADLHEINKWTNMTKAEQDAMDGQITGNKRNGPVTITIKPRPAA
jgi:hypothetical protein